MNIHKQIGIIAAMSALCMGAFAATKDEDSIRNTYAKMASAMKSKDLAAVESLEAPGYTHSAMGQTLDAAKANSMMKQEFQQVQSFSAFEIKVASIKVSGSTARAATNFRMALNTQGHVITVTGTSKDTLVKTGKGWQFKTSVFSAGKTLMDGKPFNPQGRGH
jgi:ketosteroid isomerase-like protein